MREDLEDFLAGDLDDVLPLELAPHPLKLIDDVGGQADAEIATDKALLDLVPIELVFREAREDFLEETGHRLESDAAEKFVERQLDANVEIAELPVFDGDHVEAHLIDDLFDLGGVFGEEGDAPLVFVEAGRSG